MWFSSYSEKGGGALAIYAHDVLHWTSSGTALAPLLKIISRDSGKKTSGDESSFAFRCQNVF